MMDDKDLREQLNRPHVPVDLENKIRNNWREQIEKSRRRQPIRQIITAASITAIAIFIAALNYIFIPQNLIAVAENDIKKDESEHTGITLPVSDIIQRERIHLPPQNMVVAMTKICNLNGNKTIHMKINGANHGAVHLFIKRGPFSKSTKIPDSSSSTTMPWKLIKPRPDLTVLVLYTRDMNSKGVAQLIQTMFYA